MDTDVRHCSKLDTAKNMTETKHSPYERRAYAYIERGYSVIPIAPGTKRPGQYSQEVGWRGMSDWERFHSRLPTEMELSIWYTWPEAGIGLLTGKLSGVVALDRDYDADGTEALEAIIPYTPVKKRGAKGYTAFFRYNGERSCSFNIAKARVLDVLSDGRQTLMPGTAHPDGHTYVYLTEDCLEDFDPKDLPVLPDDFLDKVAAILAPYQTDEDKKYQKKTVALPDNDGVINTSLSIQGEYFRDLNATALQKLDDWVPKLIPGAKRERDGYRCVATWRGVQNANVGVHPKGIFDFGGNYSMTAIDLVMQANQISFGKAVDMLREYIMMSDDTPLTMTVNGASALATAPSDALPAPTEAPKSAPVVLPWQVPRTSKPAQVMLPPTTSVDPAPALPTFLMNPPGILGEISRWITATAPKSQPELSLAAAIALCSVVMGRTYRSQYGNWTSLYLVMVAKSTEGKEHPQSCVEKILSAAGLTHLIGGSGYTSSGAVYSALLKEPCHIATIDEMGKLLKTSRAKGQSHTEAALDKLVEAFGRQDGVLRPPTYSTMTMTRSVANTQTERVVHNPAITLLGATTPATFYENLTDDLVKDGFLGRCIVIESQQPRQLTRFVQRTEPPEKLLEWCKAVNVRTMEQTGDIAGMLPADMAANVIELPFDESCRPLMDAFEARLNDAKESSEAEGLDVLLGRTLEKSMKIAMVVCKAENPANKVVMPHHLEWSISFINHYDNALVRAVRKNRVNNQTDADVKKAIELVRNAKKYIGDKAFGHILATGAMPHSKLLKLMKMGSRQFNEVIETAVEAGILLRSTGTEFGLGAMSIYRVGQIDD